MHRPRTVVAVQLRRELKRDEVVERDARVGGLQVLQAADEQPRAKEQQEAERDLRGYETLAQEQRPAAAGNRAHRVFERRPWIRSARANRGDQSEDDAGRSGQDRHDAEDPQVGTRGNRQRLTVIRHEREQRARQRNRKRDADDATERRQAAALDEHLADQTST